MEDDDQPHFSPNDQIQTDNRQMTNKIFGGLEVKPPYKYPFIAYVEVRKSARSNYWKQSFLLGLSGRKFKFLAKKNSLALEAFNTGTIFHPLLSYTQTLHIIQT